MPIEDAIIFECRHCGQSIEAPSEMRGMKTQCPTCGKTVKVQPVPVKRPVSKRPFIFISICLILLFVAATFALWHRHMNHSAQRSTDGPPVPPAPSQPALVENPPSSLTAASNLEHRLLQPITGAFGYTLGEKLSEELSAPQIFAFDTTNYMPFQNINIRCLNDGRICAILGSSMEDVNHIVVEQDLEKKYGQGNPTKGEDGKISRIKWSDGNREIELFPEGVLIIYRDIELEKAANRQFEQSIEEAIPKLFQPATGTLGWKLGEKLPDKLQPDTGNHTYFDRTTNYWPFELSVACLSDRRILTIWASAITASAMELPTDSPHKLMENYLEKQCGRGTFVPSTNGGISAIRWSDGRYEISLAGTTITYKDIALEKAVAEEEERSKQEAIRRLLQPITGAFGYMLGEKLRSGLPIDPEFLTYYDKTPNFPFINHVIFCLRDRRICSIHGEFNSEQFDAVKKLFEKKYGLGRPVLVGKEIWSDGKHEITLFTSGIVCKDTGLDAQWTKEREGQEAAYRLLQPITGAFGYTLGEKLPERLFIDPVSHGYAPQLADLRNDFLSFFPILVHCLSDRRVCRITGTLREDQISAVRAALEKKYGKGRSEGDGIETWGWGDDGHRTISFSSKIIIYEDDALADELKKECEHEKEERQNATIKGL